MTYYTFAKKKKKVQIMERKLNTTINRSTNVKAMKHEK